MPAPLRRCDALIIVMVWYGDVMLMRSMSVNVFQLPEGGGGTLCADAACAGVLHSVPLVCWFLGFWLGLGLCQFRYSGLVVDDC